jgi:ribose transport system substrate-binding protein
MIMISALLFLSLAGCKDEVEDKTINVGVIIKTTSSDFWQYVLVGAENYGAMHPSINVTTYGPEVEDDSKQVEILESVIATNPKVIVMASISSDATVRALENAVKKGITVIMLDNKVNTDKISSFLATDNVLGGAAAAKRIIEQTMKSQSVTDAHSLKGKVFISSAEDGSQVIGSRDKGFIDYLSANSSLTYDSSSLRTVHNNDQVKAQSNFETILTRSYRGQEGSNKLVAVFADNNTGGNAIAKVLKDEGISDINAVAYDSDPLAISAVEEGWLDALIVQDPYRMGFDGVSYGLQHVAGLSIPKFVDTGYKVITKDNVTQDEIKAYINPYEKALTR